MYLIDTSVWVDYLNENDTYSVKYFMNIIDQGAPFGITGVICQEILQGASSEAKFNELADYLDTQRFYCSSMDEKSSYYSAAKLYFDCRRQGVTIRSPNDCLIAQVALEHDLILLHNDVDFVRIANIVPLLKIHPKKLDNSVAYTLHER
jgi:predicted nucleic acid-binding protein